MNVLIAGGSGFIGKALCQALYNQGFNVSVLTRNTFSFKHTGIQPYYWNADTQTIDLEAFKDVDAIINLAGENIGTKRWTPTQKHKILQSRIASTRLLYNTIAKLQVKPNVYISASAIGYYGTQNGATAATEIDPSGTDFLAQVCLKWENEANAINQLHIRTCIVRTGIVLSPTNGALKQILSTLKLNSLMRLGSGQQPFPWIHLHDLCQIYLHLLQSPTLMGTFNATAPQINTYRHVLTAIAQPRTIKPLIIPIPPIFLRLALGEMSAILLNGTHVSCKKIENTGFHFKYPTLQTIFT